MNQLLDPITVMSGRTILGINLGSTSTEVGVLLPDGSIEKSKVRHQDELLLNPVSEQEDQRFADILSFFNQRGLLSQQVHAITCRGGRLKPIPSGTYLVNDELIQDSKLTDNGDHASRLSVLMGVKLGKALDCSVYTTDPISVNEYSPEASLTGIKNLPRISLGHALNSKFVAKKMSHEMGHNYEEVNLIIAHLGGGASISAHRKGKMIDLINDFEGALTPERCGALPNNKVVELCKAWGYERVSKLIEGQGGFYSYLGSKDFSLLLEKMHSGDELSKQLFHTYIYMNTKSIASLCGILQYDIQGFGITGGISNEKTVVDALKETFGRFAPFYVYPGSFEMEALLENAYLALDGGIPILAYPSGRPL